MKWFRMYHDARTDGKLEFLTDAQFRVWFRIMCYANEQTLRGFIPTKNKRLMAVEVAHGDVGLYEETMELLSELDIVDVTEEGITIVNWHKRQFDSDNSTNRWKDWKNKQDTNVGTTFDKHDANVGQTVNKQKSTPPDTDTEKEIKNIPVSHIIDYLNKKCGTSYRGSSKKTKQLIQARFNEGFTVDDFIAVIDKKAGEWLGTKMAEYLRPETLFGTKFESYLNAPSASTPKQPTVTHDTQDDLTDERREELNALYARAGLR